MPLLIVDEKRGIHKEEVEHEEEEEEDEGVVGSLLVEERVSLTETLRELCNTANRQGKHSH